MVDLLKPQPAIDPVHPPPRYLLGTALLFWGIMTDHPVVALPLILLLEAAHWTRLRWKFTDAAYIRTWQLCVLACFALATYTWIEGPRTEALKNILGWLPLLFFPLQFTQSYGLGKSIPLTIFSFFARQRQLRNERLGLPDTAPRINFGNIFLVCCLVGAMLGPLAKTDFFLPGLLLLIGWALLAARRTRLLPLFVSLALAGGLALAGQAGLSLLYDKVVRMAGGNSGGDDGDSLVAKTAIGQLGEVKLSPDIKWRLRPLNGQAAPRLLRTAGYDKYSSGTWENDKLFGLPADADFADIEAHETGPRGPTYLLREDADPQLALLPTQPAFTLRGGAKLNSRLPLPGSASALRGFDFDNIERNSLGTIRIAPADSVINGTVYWQNSLQPENPPSETSDRFIPRPEQATLARIAAQLKLADEPAVQGKIRIIDRFFRENFTYTRYLTISPSRSLRPGERGDYYRYLATAPEASQTQTAISIFLTRDRKGHCEYFATAAALLLRQVKVPTRYAVGFAVMEANPARTEYLIRGEHGHAWCRAWDESTKTWIDFDATPPGWFALESRRATSLQWLTDWFLRTREDFAIWRTNPTNRLRIAIGMMVLGSAALIFIIRRLWRSKQILSDQPGASSAFTGAPPRTPLHDLEAPASAFLGPRSPGLPYPRWLLGLKSTLPDPRPLEEAIELHQRLRFDPAPAAASSIEKLRQLTQAILSILKER